MPKRMPVYIRKIFAVVARVVCGTILTAVLFAGGPVAECAAEEAVESEQSTEDAEHRKAVGYVERIELYPEKLRFNAKLTPGSEGNVLHAENPETFVKNDEQWIRFKVTDRKGKEEVLERQVSGTSTFRTTRGKIKKRHLIKSGFCLDTKYVEIEFALDNRSNFEQEVRIGRDALAGHFIIDPAKTKTTKPRCKLKKSKSKKQ